jgi:hypothetical protein
MLDAADLLHAHMVVCMVCSRSHTFCQEGAKLRKAIDAAASARALQSRSDAAAVRMPEPPHDDSCSSRCEEGRPAGSE